MQFRGIKFVKEMRQFPGNILYFCSPPPEGWIPAQRISVREALAAYTRAGAWSARMENDLGVIRKGALADLVILSQDIFTIDPMQIHGTMVDYTILNGNVIYERKSSH